MDLTMWKAWLQRRLSPFFRQTRNQVKNVAEKVRTYKNQVTNVAGKVRINTNITEKVRTYILARKKQMITIAVAAVIGVAGSASAYFYYQANIIPIYHVYVNGKEIGVVNNPQVVEEWTEAKLREESVKYKGLTLKLSDYISYKEERIYKGHYDNEATLAALAQIADIKVEAAKIVVDGKVVGYAASRQEAEQVFERLKAKYAPTADKVQTAQAASVQSVSEDSPDAAANEAADEQPIKEVRFKEQVTTEIDMVPAAQVLSADKLEELLTKGTLQEVIHTVQEGDCVTCIAKKYGITSKDIYANNPDITEETVLQLGQKINVTALRPYVTVQVVEELEQEETIDYAVQTRNNDQLPQGETRVVQEGKEGKKRVRYRVVKENGDEVAREVLEEEILSEPVVKIVERGTKIIPSRGTGRFAWPAKGYISSGFGKRWGRMHQGIDIAGSGSVVAADNGKVVSAGWNGGYGNCVIIDHGNGYRTLYGHMKSISVKVGQVVSKGQKIGVMGSTGNSTGVHLHFEVHKNGTVQNPLNYLSR